MSASPYHTLARTHRKCCQVPRLPGRASRGGGKWSKRGAARKSVRREPLAVQTAKGLRPRLGAPFGSCQGHSKRSREKRGSAGLGPLLSCRKLSTRQRPRRRPTRPQALTEGHTAGEEACPGETPRRAPSAPPKPLEAGLLQCSCRPPCASQTILLKPLALVLPLTSPAGPGLYLVSVLHFHVSSLLAFPSSLMRTQAAFPRDALFPHSEARGPSC